MNAESYEDLKGISHDLTGLAKDERELVVKLQATAGRLADWIGFSNYWPPEVLGFYRSRGLANSEIVKTIPYRIAQDLGSRFAVAEGMARVPDFVSEIEELVRTKFPSRQEFCEATGISESMLSHVLHDRKDFSIAKLTDALKRIGYALHIRPIPTI